MKTKTLKNSCQRAQGKHVTTHSALTWSPQKGVFGKKKGHLKRRRPLTTLSSPLHGKYLILPSCANGCWLPSQSPWVGLVGALQHDAKQASRAQQLKNMEPIKPQRRVYAGGVYDIWFHHNGFPTMHYANNFDGTLPCPAHCLPCLSHCLVPLRMNFTPWNGWCETVLSHPPHCSVLVFWDETQGTCATTGSGMHLVKLCDTQAQMISMNLLKRILFRSTPDIVV